ncbi:Ribonuclease H-like protein [Apiospora arundinis]
MVAADVQALNEALDEVIFYEEPPELELGALHEYFPQIELLLDHLESAVDGEILSPDGRSFINIFDGLDQETRQVFRVYIRLGWKKLDAYYNSMTSLAYYMAVILHPCKKMKQLDDLWAPLPCRQTDQWKDSLNKRLRKFWQADYANRELPQEETTADGFGLEELDFVSRRIAYSQKRAIHEVEPDQASTSSGVKRPCRPNGKITRKLPPVEDELSRYLAEPPCLMRTYMYDPLRWWQEIGQLQYPKLSYMATDILTIPSSTAETERQFNSTGRMITPLRARMKRHIVGMGQSIRSWSMAGIYTPGLPLNLCDTEDWQRLLHDGLITGVD